MGFSFDDLKKSKKDKTIELDSGSTVTIKPIKDPPRGVSEDIIHTPAKPRINWKKKYDEIKKEFDSWVKSAGIRSRKMDEMAREIAATKKAYDKLVSTIAELNDEVTMSRLQEEQMKKAIDILSIQAEKFKFRPHQYSEIARLLICMRVRGNRSQKEQVLKIVGSTAIEDVREHIFKLLEAPYE